MQPIIEQLANEIRTLYERTPEGADLLIEEFLSRQLDGFDFATKMHFLHLLREVFPAPPPPPPAPEAEPENYLQQEHLLRFCSLVLGKTLSPAELASPETLERLSHSLNTIFDSLNQLVHSIHATLFIDDRQNETIRHVIGSSLSGAEPSTSLEQYLGEIKSAFFLSHQAFGSAAANIVARILKEFDPEQPAFSEGNSSMFGAVRKAHSFDRYRQVFENCKKWHDSGHSMEDFLKEFEKECQKLSQQPRR